MNIVTLFDDGRNDRAVFIGLRNSRKIFPGEVNIIIILPKKMCVLKKYPGLLAEVAKGVINNLPGQPAAGVTTIRSIKGHSANVSHGNEEGKYNATVNFSAKISAFFEF